MAVEPYRSSRLWRLLSLLDLRLWKDPSIFVMSRKNYILLGPIHTTPDKSENTALFLRVRTDFHIDPSKEFVFAWTENT